MSDRTPRPPDELPRYEVLARELHREIDQRLLVGPGPGSAMEHGEDLHAWAVQAARGLHRAVDDLAREHARPGGQDENVARVLELGRQVQHHLHLFLVREPSAQPRRQVGDLFTLLMVGQVHRLACFSGDFFTPLPQAPPLPQRPDADDVLVWVRDRVDATAPPLTLALGGHGAVAAADRISWALDRDGYSTGGQYRITPRSGWPDQQIRTRPRVLLVVEGVGEWVRHLVPAGRGSIVVVLTEEPHRLDMLGLEPAVAALVEPGA